MIGKATREKDMSETIEKVSRIERDGDGSTDFFTLFIEG